MNARSRAGREKDPRAAARPSLLGMAALAVSAGIVCGMLSIGSAAAHPTPVVAPPAAPGPQLRIAVDDGRHAAAVGDSLAYTVSAHNLGVRPVRDLTVTQTVPAGVRFRSARPIVLDRRGTLTWRVNVGVGGVATMHSVMSLEPTPSQLLRLATIVCAKVSATGAPIVGASHSDELAAGAAQASAAAVGSEPKRAYGSVLSSGWRYLTGGLLGVAVAVVLVVLLHRRHRRRLAAGVEVGVAG